VNRGFSRQPSDFFDRAHQLCLARLCIKVLRVDAECPGVELHIHGRMPSPDQRQKDAFVEFAPISQSIQYFVGSVLLNVREACIILPVKQNQSVFEIEMREIGNEGNLFFVLICKLLHCSETMSGHFGRPYGIHREEDQIFPPLFQNAALNLSVGFEFQGLVQILQQEKSLLYEVPQWLQILGEEGVHHPSNPQRVALINLGDQLPGVRNQRLNSYLFFEDGGHLHIEQFHGGQFPGGGFSFHF